MPIDFHDERNKNSYSSRNADKSWKDAMKSLTEGVVINKAADIGCGCGNYCKAIHDMGGPFVSSVDYSAWKLKETNQKLEKYDRQVSYKIGYAYNTGLPDD